jgi:hypothetical protein
MRFFKKVIVISVLTTGLALPVSAQSNSELSVEESFLRESIPIMMIREQARSDDRDGKQLALDYVQDLFDGGGDKLQALPVLTQLSREGILDRTLSEGRIANNFPEVRIRACELMGVVGTVEASKALVEIILVEKEPAVLTEAVRAITKIGLSGYAAGESSHPLDTVNFIFNHYNAVQPDNRFAYAVIQAAETLVPQMGGSSEDTRVKTNTLDILRRINANHNYVPTTRAMARRTQTDLIRSLQ